MADNLDVFGRKIVTPVKAITADMCTIIWAGDANNTGNKAPVAISSASNISIQYQQQINRRRALGGNGSPIAVIYPSQPFGSISIQRLIAETAEDIFSRPGWNICEGTARLTISFDGASAYEGCTTKGYTYPILGASVTGYSIAAEAEGLTVVDGVQIEFLQMLRPKKV